jgi:hypothetical protein
MPSNRWVDRTQPQTLMMATLLMYINAALGAFSLLLSPGSAGPLVAVLVFGPVAAGWGIANEKKWGYWLGLSLTLVEVAYLLLFFGAGSVITLLFYIALAALLLHPESRAYRRTWFR